MAAGDVVIFTEALTHCTIPWRGPMDRLTDAAAACRAWSARAADADALWYHGYFVKDQKHAPFKWGRGNGWFAVALLVRLYAKPALSRLVTTWLVGITTRAIERSFLRRLRRKASPSWR